MYNNLILPTMTYILPLMFFYKDGFGFKTPMKVDMLLKKERNRTGVNIENRRNLPNFKSCLVTRYLISSYIH